MAKFDDELDVLPTKLAAKTPETPKSETIKEPAVDDDGEVPVKSTPTTTTPTAIDEDEDLDIEFGDQKFMAKGDGLNRIRAEKGKVVRFALLDFIKPKKGVSHFVDTKDKKGTFRCLPVKTEGEIPYCCATIAEEGMQHVVALAVQYTNSDPKTGKYEKGATIDWEVGYVDLSRSNYRSVSTLPPEDSSVYDIDIVMSKKENGIGYEFTLAAVKSRWKTNPDLAEEVKGAAQKFINDGGKKLISKLGRKLNLNEWKALLAGQAASGKEADLTDIDEL